MLLTLGAPHRVAILDDGLVGEGPVRKGEQPLLHPPPDIVAGVDAEAVRAAKSATCFVVLFFVLLLCCFYSQTTPLRKMKQP